MYKIKHKLPLSARLQIFHSFVQSHLNFCSLIWGFAAKSHIESLFSAQKKAMRAIMHGYVNYFYDDGLLPASTRSSFNDHNILTVHNIIIKNAITLMHRVMHFPDSLPPSIVQTIPPNIPTIESDHRTSADWLSIYSNYKFKNSIFFKGPLLFISPEFDNTLTLACFQNYNVHKKTTKNMLLSQQRNNDDEDWPAFLLHNIPGLRKSARSNNLIQCVIAQLL